MKVLIIGAGASHASDSSMPLMEGFFDPPSLQDEKVYSSQRVGRYGLLRSFIDFEFGLSKMEGGLEGPPVPFDKYVRELNVEEVFVHLDLMLNAISPDTPLYGELLTARAQLLDYIDVRLKYSDKRKVDQLKGLLEVLDDGDTIISFNWDLLFDSVLIRSGESFPVRQSGGSFQSRKSDVWANAWVLPEDARLSQLVSLRQ